MRATARRTTDRRALALAMALAIPLLTACGPDEDQGLDAVTGAAGELQVLVGGPAETGDGAAADPSLPVLSGPGGVAVNQGVRYVADTGNQRVLRTSQDGTCVLVAGEAAPVSTLPWCDGSRVQDQLRHPTAITVDRGGDVFIADPVADRVFMVDASDRTLTAVAGDGVQGLPVHGAVATRTSLHTPTSVSVTGDGATLYVADSGAHQVLAVDVSALTAATPAGPALAPAADGAPGTDTSPPAPADTSTSAPPSEGSPSPTSTSGSTSGAEDPLFDPADGSDGSDGSDVTDVTDGSGFEATRLEVVTADEDAPLGDDGSATSTAGTPQPGGDEDGPTAAGEPTETSSAPADDSSGRGSTSDDSGTATGLENGTPPEVEEGAAGRLYVVAGPGCAPGPGGRPELGATVPALTAGLSSPSALVVAEGGEVLPELYVADRANHQVYVIDIAGGAADQPRELTTLSSDDPQLMTPVALAVAHLGGARHVVAADADTHAVLRARSWDRPLEWTSLTSELRAPSALAGDRSAVLVADSTTDTVYGLPLEDAEPSPSPEPDEVLLLSATVPVAEDAVEAPVEAAAPTCAAAPAPTTGGGSTSDPGFTPQSTPSPSRPKVPGHAVDPGPGTHRFSGDDRVGTSIDTSRKLFPKTGSVPVVVISSASSYADSAGGARYAAEKGGALLLTPGNRLDPAVEAEVRRALASGGSIVVTGREDAIAPSVFSALEAIAPGRTERIGGTDRYETATKLAQRLADQMTTTATGPIYLVTGADHPDALVVVPLARRTGGLVVLSKDDVLPPVTKALLQQLDPTGARTVPVGGAAAAAAASLGGDAGRTAASAAVVGSDRYETARKVAERFVALDAAAGARTDVVGLATGTTWPDALVGSTAMGTLVGPLLLGHGDQLDPNVVKVLAAIPSSRPSTAVVFGGESAVPASVAQAFGAAARG